MKKLFALFALLLAVPSFAADVKISALPLGSAASTSTTDSFPFVFSATNITKRLTLWDLSNIPTIVSTYAPKANPTFTGVATAPSFVGALTGNASTATALTSTLGVAGGGTGLISGTAGGVLSFTGSTTLASSLGGSSGQILRSTGTSTVPTWSTATYPATTTVSQLLYSSSANVVAGLATANTGVLVTSSAGIPSIQACTVANRVLRTDGTTLTCAQVAAATDVSGQVAIANGGTGAATKAAGFDALSPMSALGDVIYGGASGTGTRLAGGTTGQVLTANTSAAPTYTYPNFTPEATKSSNYTVTATDGLLYGSGTFQFTLPAANAAGVQGRIYRFVKTDTAGTTLTIARAGADTINGLTSITLTIQYESVVLISDGTSLWSIF